MTAADDSFDTILDSLGAFGRYQVTTTLLLCIAAGFINAWAVFTFVFFLYTPDKTCTQWDAYLSAPMEKLANSSDQCAFEANGTVKCVRWSYDNTYFESTISTQWDLVCDYEIWTKNALAIFTACNVIGSFFMSFIQDYLGRKKAFIISLTFVLMGGLFSLLAPSFGGFVALRGALASQVIASYNIPFVWSQEFMGPSKRTYGNFLMTVIYCIATVSLGLVAYLCSNWIQLGLATTVPFVLFYSYIFLLDESPRWLLGVGKKDEAMKIIEKMAHPNKVSADQLQVIRNRLQSIENQNVSSESKCSQLMSSRQLMKTSNLRRKTILITLTIIANNLIYTTLGFNAGTMNNIYVAYVIQAAVEFPACIVNVLLSNRIGRLLPIFFAMVISAFFCFMCIPAYIGKWNEWWVIAFTAAAKFGICISFNNQLQAAGELYPTVLRGTGMNFSSVVAEVFILTMPYILASASAQDWLPMMVLGTVTAIGAICVVMLPETMDAPMPQTVDDAEKMGTAGSRAARNHWLRITCRKSEIMKF